MTKQPLVPWDYLIVTASNDAQASAYESQLRLRHRRGALPGVRHVLVVADPEGKRVGSGGSTLCCLMEVVNRELAVGQASRLSASPHVPDKQDARPTVESILRSLRILIIHAGGDSRRLPAYGPCGKIFIPVPGKADPALGCALFDRIAPRFMALPPAQAGCGQVVMAAGDALILFDPSNVSLAQPGLTALTCLDTPEQAGKHGVFCPGRAGRVRLYLQKPSVATQHELGAIQKGQSLLDIGIMSFDATMAVALLQAFGIKAGRDGQLAWPTKTKRDVLARGVDFFREVCCALGDEATAEHHAQQAKSAGSTWSDAELGKMFSALRSVPFHLQVIPHARFLHFGTTRQLITSGEELRGHDQPRAAGSPKPLSLDNELRPGGKITGASAWVEACRLSAPLQLGGNNVVIGVEATEPLALSAGACMDVLSGANRTGKKVWFIRCYGIKDTFKDTVAKGGTFCGLPLLDWLAAIGAKPEDIWDKSLPAEKRSLWDARVFPAEAKSSAYRKWLWVFDPTKATEAQKKAFLAADRFSAAEVSTLADQDHFFARRRRLRRGVA